MMSAVRWIVARRRSEITIMTARCSSEVETSSARCERTSLISTWWFHRFTRASEGLVKRASSVRLRPT